MQFLNVKNRDVISNIFIYFDECKPKDVKKMFLLMNMYPMLYNIIFQKIEHLIKFYKDEKYFKYLGHREAIKTKDIRIVKYLELKYRKKFINFLQSNDLYKIAKHEFYELIEYINIKRENEYDLILFDNLMTGFIKYNKYDQFKYYVEKYGNGTKIYDLDDNIYEDLFITAIESGNIKFMEYFGELHFEELDNEHFVSAIEKGHINMIDYLLKKNNYVDLYSLIKYAKTLEMYKYIMGDIYEEITVMEDIITYLLYDKNFEIFDYIIKNQKVDIKKILEIRWDMSNKSVKTHKKIMRKLITTFGLTDEEFQKKLRELPIKNMKDLNYISRYVDIDLKEIFIQQYNYINQFNVNLFEYCIKTNKNLVNFININKSNIYLLSRLRILKKNLPDIKINLDLVINNYIKKDYSTISGNHYEI